MLKRGFIIVALLFVAKNVLGFSPSILTYSTKDYNAHQVNYDVLFDERGVMYAANAYGIMSYDGETWKLVPMSASNSPVSLCLSADKKLYIGANNDLGYAEADARGVLKFHSLSHLLPDSLKKNIGWVHHCAEYKGKIYFASEFKIFVFNGKNLSVMYPEKGNKFLFVDNIQGELCIMELGKGIGFMGENDIEWLKGSGEIKDIEIRCIERKGKNSFYLYGREAIYLFENANLQRITKLDLMAGNVVSDVVISDHHRVICTEQSGAFVLDKNFEIVYHFSEDIGNLSSNFIYSVAQNKQGDICFASNNGIAIAALSSPVLNVNSSSGIRGAGYSSLLCDKGSYLGTSQGLYFAPIGSEKYAKVEGVQAFVRAIFEHEGVVFCADQKEVYQINNGVAKIISKNSWRGAWLFKSVPKQKNIFLVGTYSGIDVYSFQNGVWSFHHTIQGFYGQARTFEFDDNGSLWVSGGSNGLVRLQLDNQYSKVLLSEDYCKKLNLSLNYFSEIIKDEGQVYIASLKGIYKVDGNYLLNENWVEGLSLNRIRKIKEGLLYTIENRQPLLLKKSGKGYVIDSTHLLNNINVELIGNSELIESIGKNLFLIGTPDGFLWANNELAKKYFGNVALRQIENIENDSLLDLTSFEIPYSSNNLRFHFSYSPLEKFYDVQWYVMLEENGIGEWKKLDKAHFKEYTNLYEGDYVFKVKAVSRFTLLGEASYAFSILPPWYRTVLAKVIYFLLFVFIIYLVYRLWKKRLYNLQKKMEEEKKRELLVQENLHKAEILQKELQEKENELSFIALNYSQKKELFEHVNEKLDDMLEKLDDPRALRNEIKGLEYSLKTSDGDEEKKWLEFQVHFNKEHNDYLEKIKAVDPKMKESMLLMCTYIRMGKSNKDICDLLNISINALDKRKSRLREKFNVPEEITLNEYLRQL